MCLLPILCVFSLVGCYARFLYSCLVCVDVFCLCLKCPPCFFPAGQLVWRRHSAHTNPSGRAIRTTCMQLLPLVEMYCKWELEEDCSNLRELMLRFDSEAELETHELGRSLLHMLRDDDIGLRVPPPPLCGSPLQSTLSTKSGADLPQLTVRSLVCSHRCS